MAEASNISWTKSTFNPWMGCQRVSPACENCYAESFVTRRMKLPLWGPTAERKVTSDANWKNPLKWHKKANATGEFWPVFCASLADVFEDRRDLDAPRERLWELITRTPALTWLLLTKRPDQINRLIPARWRLMGSLPGNVWIGTTIEDHRRASERMHHLLDIKAKVRFVSVEPQLEALSASNLWLNDPVDRPEWVITGGESGPNSRFYATTWARMLIADCRKFGVPIFVKQLGERWARENGAKSRHGADPTEWPEDLRVQEVPKR